MAKKKKVLTDNDYEEFNKWIAEEESKPAPVKIELVHDDGSIWYQGIRGGHGDRDYVRHRLQYPAIPFSVMLESDALSRFNSMADDESSSVEDVCHTYASEGSKLDPVSEPIKPEDLDNAAALAYYFAIYLQDHEGFEKEIVSLCSAASNMFREVAHLTPIVYDQYVVASLDLMATAYMKMGNYENAEQGYKEALDISRQDMIKFGKVDWAARLVHQYWHIGNLYENWGKPKKAIAYYEEGWSTFNAAEESVIAEDIDGIEESLCQLYQQCGMSEKLQKLQAILQEYEE